MTHIIDEAYRRMAEGFGQTFAEVLFLRPLEKEEVKEAHSLLHIPPQKALVQTQTFQWQFDDLAPKFPKLMAFLDTWDKTLSHAPIQKVRFAHQKLLTKMELQYVRNRWYITAGNAQLQ